MGREMAFVRIYDGFAGYLVPTAVKRNRFQRFVMKGHRSPKPQVSFCLIHGTYLLTDDHYMAKPAHAASIPRVSSQSVGSTWSDLKMQTRST